MLANLTESQEGIVSAGQLIQSSVLYSNLFLMTEENYPVNTVYSFTSFRFNI